MMISKKVVVIGAGAAGLMAGATAALYGASVTIIEKNKRVGRKIMITAKEGVTLPITAMCRLLSIMFP